MKHQSKTHSGRINNVKNQPGSDENSGTKSNFRIDTEKIYLAGASLKGEFTGLAEFFCAAPPETSSFELDTTLTGVIGIGGNGLARSSTPMPVFISGAAKTSSEEGTCLPLVRRLDSPSTAFSASSRERLAVH